MPIHNADCAEVFSEIADLLAIQGTNPFRVCAYRNAARTVTVRLACSICPKCIVLSSVRHAA